MNEPKRWRLEIDGEEFTADCDALDFSMPAVVYEVPHDDGRRQRRHLGPKGFSVTLTAPSDRLRALVDDGVQVRQIRIGFGAEVLPVPVAFHEEWVERSGVRKMFGCMPVDRESEPKWVTESGAHAGEPRIEGGQSIGR